MLTRRYQLKFQSEAQREVFEELLMSMQVTFREVEANLAEEPEAEYQTVDPALLKMTEADWENIRLGEEDLKAGRTVPWEEVKAELEQRVKRLTESQDAS